MEPEPHTQSPTLAEQYGGHPALPAKPPRVNRAERFALLLFKIAIVVAFMFFAWTLAFDRDSLRLSRNADSPPPCEYIDPAPRDC